MSRWIEEADFLLHLVKKPRYSSKTIGEAIDESHSIDIVRCRECAKANTENCSHSYWDDDWGVWRVGYKGDDWFCADGEREGE